MILADLGADIVKIEPLPDGEMSRAWGPFHHGVSTYFLGTNRNKRGIAVDFRKPEGLALIREMVRGGRAGGEFQARHDDSAWLRIAACRESALDHGARHGFRQFRLCQPMAGIRSDRARVFGSHEPDRHG
jgi:hypothetical protein